MQKLQQIKESTLIFVIGAGGYSLIEILWRGFTHWSMSITGGLCFTFIYFFNGKCTKMHWYNKCTVGAAIITSIEFVVGCIVNLIFRLNVWDYSHLHFNVLGQISLLFSVLWFLLCIPVFKLCTFLQPKRTRPPFSR